MKPGTLTGSVAQLEPLGLAHLDGLHLAGKNASIWTYMPIPFPRRMRDTESWVKEAMDQARQGNEFPFVIRDLRSNKVCGSTRYMDIQAENRSLEIGWTWINPELQRSAINTECKLLLLAYSFEEWKAHRVQLKTDARNLPSQKAIERIGAKLEGQHRKHRINWDGYVRDTVYYSIIDSEWPEVKQRLLGFLTKPVSV